MADGRVLVVEIKSGHAGHGRIPTARSTRVATTGGGPNGAALGPDGKVYVCNNGGFVWAEFDGIAAPGPQPADYIGGRIQRVDIDTRRGRGPLHRVRRQPRCAGRTTSCSTTTAASTSPTSASRGPVRSTRPASTTPRRTARRSPRSSTGSTTPTASRCRPTARRALRRRDDHRAAVDVGHRVAGRARAGDHAVRPGHAALQLRRASSCSTRWPSTATATSAWPRSITGAISVVSPQGRAARPVHGARVRPRSSRTSASAAPT